MFGLITRKGDMQLYTNTPIFPGDLSEGLGNTGSCFNLIRSLSSPHSDGHPKKSWTWTLQGKQDNENSLASFSVPKSYGF